MCGTGIPADNALVHQVTKLEIKDTVMKQAQLHGDVFGAAIINRIQPITDMVAANCKYHDKCVKKLYISRPKVHEKKRSVC